MSLVMQRMPGAAGMLVQLLNGPADCLFVWMVLWGFVWGVLDGFYLFGF